MNDRISLLSLAIAALAASLTPSEAAAFEPFALQIPCRATAVNSAGTERPCITCHNNADGGSGCDEPPCWNDFGAAFDSNGLVWNAALAALDSDGDGYTNGEELGDPDGTWMIGMADPAACGCATRPGYGDFTPGDEDTDGDGVCCRGRDVNGDGDCLDDGEDMRDVFDCDPDDELAYSSATEICTNTADNDCDGDATLTDSDCAAIVDRDGDGYCPMGRDNNGNRNCIDPGEDTGEVDCDDTEVTVSPISSEFCVDGLDNDCDEAIDTDDDECTSDVDADDDGYCPIGRDLDDDGNCNGTVDVDGVPTVEAEAGFDCNDDRPEVNPGADEICGDSLDNDCDGLADFRDAVDCGAFYDADSDGYCPMGRDADGDRACTTEAELGEPGDCNDEDPSINPGLSEVCSDDIDQDCDTAELSATTGVLPEGWPLSLADTDCEGWRDTDGDTFCFVGVDTDLDGHCADEGEDTGDGDCDETNRDVNPGQPEVCTDLVDNDCDGSADAFDRADCVRYRDTDSDGWCLEGQDMNRDGDCADAGEQTAEREREDTENDPTRYPGAPENCLNGVDEDLDDSVDEAGYCVRDTDADGDGYCPIGQDLDGDGSCEGEGENVAVTDCNDDDDAVSPGEAERCLEPVDADCDGLVGTDDPDCFVLLDRDGDGFCPTGIDDNGDGDCLDEREDRFGMDCDDRNADINALEREVCDDGIDNDCDGAIDWDDTQCSCDTDDECDDGDACTLDMCVDGDCSSSPDPVCSDAGVGPDAGTEPEPGSGCGCRTVGASRSILAPWMVPLALLGFVALRRRRRCER